jgi:hypothetical protein
VRRFLSRTVIGSIALFSIANAGADLHPIVEIETGYLFGATAKEKWITTGQRAKSVSAKTIYRVYSLTEQVGETEGNKPNEPCGQSANATRGR